jgi:hypothetical protein|nr:hypothetical protein [uncultured Mediterranean phage uvMED]|tara:strand:+ start:437 stop:811 length:375 start_codon:yes stop_codon:yes gene_type:complete
MWIFNDDGFFSTVVDAHDHSRLAVRSRDGNSLIHFLDSMEIDRSALVKTPERDYPYRVYVNRDIWVRYMRNKAEALDYVDYKSHMVGQRMHHPTKHIPRKWINRLGDIWALLYDGWEVRGDGDG